MKRKPLKGKSLAKLNPLIAQEWHSIKNGDLTPDDVSVRSGKKVWWKCDKGDDHEWEAQIYHRDNGIGCPICSNRKIVNSNCLATLNPKLAQEWHLTKNGGLTPNDVGVGTVKKVWWKCDKGDDHEWDASVVKRSNGKGCPICSGHKLAKSTSLAILKPSIAKQWHPTKNGDLTPFDVSIGTHKKVWWKCDKGNDHEWEAPVNNRSKGSGCAVCVNQVVVNSNCLATVYPELAEQWHPTKNGNLTPNDVTFGSNKKVWWKCDKGDDHEWEAIIVSRHKGIGCPICLNKKIVISNSLATTNPELAKQWHPTKNGDLSPYDVSLGSHKKVWWKCYKGDDHEWQSVIKNRKRGDGCTICSGRRNTKTDL